MTEALALGVLQETVKLALLLALPLLGAALVVGLDVSLFQAVTQIHEMTLTFVPKLLATAALLVMLGSWMLHRLVGFTQWLFSLMPQLAR